MWTNHVPPRGRGWRSRYPGRASRPSSRWSGRDDSTIPQPPSPPLGPLLQTLTELDLSAAGLTENHDGGRAEITDCAYVASFNWLDRDEPTILVPGMGFRTHLECTVHPLMSRMT